MNTPLELPIRNQSDRFSLVANAIDRMPCLGVRVPKANARIDLVAAVVAKGKSKSQSLRLDQALQRARDKFRCCGMALHISGGSETVSITILEECLSWSLGMRSTPSRAGLAR